MPNLLEESAAWLIDKLATSAGLTITYARGDDETELVAVQGQSQFEQVDEHGVVGMFDARDFIIKTSELVLDGVQVLPRAGDQIRETLGDQVLVYEVMSPGNEPPYRYCDPRRQSLRVHTKQVETEEV